MNIYDTINSYVGHMIAERNNKYLQNRRTKITNTVFTKQKKE